ncbi:class I SAM-dependent methyltransferase [Tropicimonas aquimaris]|uniref:Class I SAM-dependent methyltransferase n=1 Tax=Tropicimonas aquimaris TaxID=914152 RepID=A0ABW3ITS7_9RHOB
MLMDRALGKARAVPTMLGAEEQRLYFWLAAFWAEGTGEIVDLGCFAGGSTARLAEGLDVSGHDARVHAFDRFTAGEDVKRSILYPQGITPFEGADILPLAQDLLAPWGDRIRFHRGEIDEMAWCGDPIELLIMDASKAADTMDRMAEAFLPHLVPGRSLLVQQDFLHWSQPWVPVQMERLSEFFTPLVHVPRDTLVFLCHRTPTRQDLCRSRTADLSDKDLLGYLEMAHERYADWGLAARLDETIRGLRANPGKRRAFQFRRPG